MKFESLEKCGGKWFSSLDRSAQNAVTDLGYYIY